MKTIHCDLCDAEISDTCLSLASKSVEVKDKYGKPFHFRWSVSLSPLNREIDICGSCFSRLVKSHINVYVKC